MKELSNKLTVPFNCPTLTGSELDYIKLALDQAHLCADGTFTEACQKELCRQVGSGAAFLTNSGSSALEMAAMIADIKPGDEIILPSFTFLSTASAFALQGGIPVFVDIDENELNIDEDQVAEAIGKRTRAIVPVHYAGVCCNMDELSELARSHTLLLIEDAAHALHSEFKGRQAGSFGNISVFSFHAAKNINCGEGGAVLLNDVALKDRAQMLWDKGTDKRSFFEGKIDHYSWKILSSAFSPSEITAAFLLAQLECSKKITEDRIRIWQRYFRQFEDLETKGFIRRQKLGSKKKNNGHIFFILLENHETRDSLIAFLKEAGVTALFHYTALHLSEAGKKFGRTHGNLANTERLSKQMLRLPIWYSMDEDRQDYVVEQVYRFFGLSS